MSTDISILVTGGSGFVGRLIVDAILQRHDDWRTAVFDKEETEQPLPSVRYIKGDITCLDDIEAAVADLRPHAVIHCAGLVPPLHDRFNHEKAPNVMAVNVGGTQNALEASKRHGVSAFIWTGSCTAVTDNFRFQYRNIDESYPTSTDSLPYGKSKALAETIVLAANSPKLSTCALRPSVLFGPGVNQLISSIHACIAKKETPYVLGDSENLWDVSYAPNIADAHVLAVENLLSTKTAAGEAIFIQNNEPITFRDFCLEVWKNFGHYPPFEVRIPLGLASAVGYIAEAFTWLVGTTYTLSRGSVMDACATRYASGAKAKKLLGYEPRTGIEEGIRISCESYKDILHRKVTDQRRKED